MGGGEADDDADAGHQQEDDGDLQGFAWVTPLVIHDGIVLRSTLVCQILRFCFVSESKKI